MTKPKQLPSRERLLELFWYDESIGELRWKITKGSNAKAGSLAGKLQDNNYRVIKIDYNLYFAHRLIWQYFNGNLTPDCRIDHRDVNPLNNRIENLRLATMFDNMHNVNLLCTNKSGIKGVSFDKWSGMWQGCIENKGKRYHQRFATKELAETFVKDLRIQLHNEFTNHGE